MPIVMSQIELAEENSDVVLLNPHYAMPDYDGGHLSTNGYRWYGELMSKSLIDDDDKKDDVSDDDQSDDKDDSDDSEDDPDDDEQNYEAMYNQLMAPFRAAKREIKLDNVEDARRLLKMGVDYSMKMQKAS